MNVLFYFSHGNFVNLFCFALKIVYIYIYNHYESLKTTTENTFYIEGFYDSTKSHLSL